MDNLVIKERELKIQIKLNNIKIKELTEENAALEQRLARLKQTISSKLPMCPTCKGKGTVTVSCGYGGEQEKECSCDTCIGMGYISE